MTAARQSAKRSAVAPSRIIEASDGVPLAVFTQGDPERRPVLLVHGYPDTHRVWDKTADILAADHYVIRYDVRGAGASGRPVSRAGYRLDRLADDLFAVLAAVSPGRAAHVVGHDWGSIQSWHAVTDQRAEGRIASFTTISGPCLDHAAFWFRDRLSHPSRRRLAELAAQAVRSWYIAVFQLPVLAPLTWRLFLARAWPTVLRHLEGVTPRDGHPAPTLASDAVSGIGLYRANFFSERSHSPLPRTSQVPVLLITVTGDRYVSPALAGADLDRWVPDLTRRTLRGKHWSVLEKKEVADLIREFTWPRGA
jgi:pimeloyl-ACP methyl ester carboxylesterase